MERRALVPMLLGFLCFLGALMLRSPSVRGAMMVLAAGLIVYAVSLLSKSRK